MRKDFSLLVTLLLLCLQGYSQSSSEFKSIKLKNATVTEFSTDATLHGTTANDARLPTEKAVRDFILNREKGVINVEDYGAKANDGLSDSLSVKAAIQIAVSRGGGIVYFPSIGTYNLPPIKVPNRVVLRGIGDAHSSVDVPAHNYAGTVLLIDGVAGKSDIEFVGNTSFSGLENMSVWNNNGAAIEAVVKIPGVLYPRLSNIEISSVQHTTGIGLYILGYDVAPWFFSSLYSTYLNVNVITNQTVGVRVGLELWGISNTLPANASRFLGGHFQGYELSLLTDGADGFGPYSGPQGVAFLGTTFENYFNAAQKVEFVPNSKNMQAFSEDSARYGVIWINLKKANQVTFTGCYFENGGVPFNAYNDGVHGTHRAFPMVLLDTNTNMVSIQPGCTITAGILDRGSLNNTPNKMSFIDEYGWGSIVERATKGFTGSEIEISTNGVEGFKQRKDTSFVRKIIIGDFVADTLRVIKKQGAVIVLGDSVYNTTLRTKPINTTTSHFVITTEGQEQIELEAAKIHLNKRLQLLPTELPIDEATPYYLMYDPNDSLVKRASNVGKSNYTVSDIVLDFPNTLAHSSSDLTVTMNGVTPSMVAIVNSNLNPASTSWTAFISGANTVTVRFNNYSDAAIDPFNGATFNIRVIQ